MTKLMLLATLLATAAPVASAAPTPTPAPPPAPSRPPQQTCAATGGIAFELEVDRDAADGHDIIAMSRVALYDTGAWTTSLPAKDSGALAVVASGCLDHATTARARADLARAPWAMLPNPVPCSAVSATTTVVSIRGKQITREDACMSETLDDVSAAQLADLRAIMTGATTPAGAVGSGRGKPTR